MLSIKNLLLGVLLLGAAACKKDQVEDTTPTVKIVSPVAGAKVAKGEGKDPVKDEARSANDAS
jgi:hypothetical protein